MAQEINLKKPLLYKPTDITESILKEQFKTKLSVDEHDFSKNKFKEIVGEPHQFDYKTIEGLEQKFGLVGAIEDKIIDYTLGPGLFIESDNEKVVTILEKFIKKTYLEIYLRPWFKAALGKGSGYLEIAGLSDIEKSEVVKCTDSNTIYVKRDEYGVVLDYVQYTGSITGTINPDKVQKLIKDDIIQLNINQIGNQAYGMGIVFAAIPIINDFLNAQSSMHKIMRRKANNPIHAKIGNVENEDYPEQADINAFGASLQYMNDMTEWVTGPNVEMKVLDFGNVGDKFDFAISNDLKLMSYAFQVPEAILGADKGFVGSTEIQDSGFGKNIRAYQKQIGHVLKTKVFDLVLLHKGIEDADYEVVWGKQSDEEVNKIRDSYQKMIATMNMSPGMKLAYEKKIALLDGIDYEEVMKENEKVMRRENREKKQQFGRDIELQQVKKTPFQKEHQAEHNALHEYLIGKAPQETEALLMEKYSIEENKAKEIVDNILEDYESECELEEWIGEFLHVKKEIIEGIKGDPFENLLAKDSSELKLGKLSQKQVDQLRTTMEDAFENKRGLNEIAKEIKKLKLPDRYIMKDGKKVLSVSAEKRPYMLARSETVRLRANGTLISYENKGQEEVEFTLVSARPCPECESLNGNIYKINEAYGLIPVHTNCRCKFSEVK